MNSSIKHILQRMRKSFCDFQIGKMPGCWLILVFGLLASCLMPHASFGQTRSIDSLQVTVELDNESLLDLFHKIEQQSKIFFAYKLESIEPMTGIMLPKATRTIRETLDLVFRDTGFRFRQLDNSILITGTLKKNSSESGNPERTGRGEVTGTVRDKTGTPMPGVSIYRKGTQSGTSTDENGNFTVEASPDDVLILTFIGYKTTEQPVGPRTNLDLTLEEDTNVLTEVVINGGYYETTDKLKTGSIVKVTAKEIENQPVTSPLLALQGRVPGLEITSQVGTPGAAPIIRIRGFNSLRSHNLGKSVPSEINGNEPLYVIDGVQISSTPIRSFSAGTSFSSGGYDPLSTINPNDIVSIEILKDGDATAIYGSRGANGVILVTTKRKLKSLDQTNFEINAYGGVGQLSQKMDLLNTRQYLTMRKEAHTNDEIPIDDSAFDLTKWDTTRYTDWQEKFLSGNATISDIQIGISSGGKNTSFSFSSNYHKESLIFSGDFGFVRGSGNLSVNHTSNNQKFNASVTANYGIQSTRLFNGDLLYQALTLPPNAPRLHDDYGNLNWEIHSIGGRTRPTWINPLSYLEQKQESGTRNLIANGNFSYLIVPSVTASASIGLTDLTGNENSVIPISSQLPTSSDLFGFANFTDAKRKSWTIEPKISFNRKWNVHSLELITGGTWQQGSASSKTISGEGYIMDALLGSLKGAGKVTVAVDNTSEYKYMSLYGRVGYKFDQKYLVNLTARRDGSSRFGPGNRFANFWSAGAAWIFSEEGFLKDNRSVLNFGKLRASYGVTGSDNVGDYQYYNLYTLLGNPKYQGTVGTAPAALFNPDFAWELTKKLEAAIELSFFENRISAELNWYRNRSSNQLVNYTLPATAGFPSVLQNFDATIQNTGWEFIVRGDALSSADWHWNVSLNMTIPRNELLEFAGIEDSPYAEIYQVGKPLSIPFLYKYRGVNPETGLYEFEDRNNDGKYDFNDKMLISSMGTSVYGGLNNTIQYKGLEISFLLQFTKQRKLKPFFANMPGGNANQPDEVIARWQNSGDQTNIQRYSIIGGFISPAASYTAMTESDAAIADASFVRIRTLSINYSLPSQWIEPIKLKQVRIFLQGQNLFTVTKYKALDPETGNSLPPLRIVTLGIQMKF